MIRRAVDFALNNRLLVIAVAILLFIWGVISFRSLPVEAYPDVANNYVQVITQWPGISAEQVEQQVTIPLEIVMNGIPHLRASAVDFAVRALQPDADFRRRVGERLESREGAGTAVASQLAGRRAAADGRRLQPRRPDLFLHAAQHQSAIRRDGPEIARRLGHRETVQVRAECRRRGQLRRPHARISGARRSRTS